MKIRIKENNQYYKDLVGQEFDVVESFDFPHDNLYFIKGKELETRGNWFSKDDCIILDADYLKGIESLRLKERLEYYKTRITECEESAKSYKSGEYKESFEDEADILYCGSLCQIGNLSGKVELLENLLGIKRMI